MISLRQMRAARALLNWSQADLAKRTGISLRALANIESGSSVPRASTQAFLKEALERGGVEFLPADGVRLRDEVLEIHSFEGDAALRILFSDPLDVLEDGGEALGLNLNERYFVEHGGAYLDHFYKEVRRRGIRERLLVRRGDLFLVSAKENYRWISGDLFAEVPFIVYGNTVMQVLWGDVLKVILIRNEAMAAAYRKQFEYYWDYVSEDIP